jgi:hypothetical protein
MILRDLSPTGYYLRWAWVNNRTKLRGRQQPPPNSPAETNTAIHTTHLPDIHHTTTAGRIESTGWTTLRQPPQAFTHITHPSSPRQQQYTERSHGATLPWHLELRCKGVQGLGFPTSREETGGWFFYTRHFCEGVSGGTPCFFSFLFRIIPLHDIPTSSHGRSGFWLSGLDRIGSDRVGTWVSDRAI